MNEYTHLDLFSGLGGFAVAANDAGFRTVAFCESDTRCRDFLGKTWGLPVEPDVRQLDGRKYAGVSLLTGGPPCQPASRAGKQGGEADNRWLWGEALRVLEEAKPDSVVFENPPGILDVGIDGILSEMGRFGYEVQCFDIPACAVDSPQLRHRIWIIGFLADTEKRGQRTNGSASRESGYANQRDKSLLADSDSQRRRLGRAEVVGSVQERQREVERDAIAQPSGGDDMANARRERSWENESERGPERGTVDRRDCESELADGHSERRERRGAESREAQRGQSLGSASGLHWQNSVWVPCADGKLRRAPDDSFSLVDGLHRSVLGALGNSIVPQVACEILKAVKKTLTLSQDLC
jgi:DNA (cytosine-5)-methyltransferase 1